MVALHSALVQRMDVYVLFTALICRSSLFVRDSRQEAQLLLGDRAMRKHAKDCRNGPGNDNLG